MTLRLARARSGQRARARSGLVAACTLLGVSIVTTAAGGGQTASAQSDDELARIGLETTEKICTQCHGIEDVTGIRRTAREWNETVATMVVKGASGTDDQFALIKRYLTRYYGVVAVNTASAEELSAVLGLIAKDAKAIVDYRQANGKFADAEALAKVPGIDRSKIDDQIDALQFE